MGAHPPLVPMERNLLVRAVPLLPLLSLLLSGFLPHRRDCCCAEMCSGGWVAAALSSLIAALACTPALQTGDLPRVARSALVYSYYW